MAYIKSCLSCTLHDLLKVLNSEKDGNVQISGRLLKKRIIGLFQELIINYLKYS